MRRRFLYWAMGERLRKRRLRHVAGALVVASALAGAGFATAALAASGGVQGLLSVLASTDSTTSGTTDTSASTTGTTSGTSTTDTSTTDTSTTDTSTTDTSTTDTTTTDTTTTDTTTTATTTDDGTVTYTGTQTIPVPPASNFAGTGGGDGWAVALTPQAVYNVFHHNSQLRVACHLQSDASPCWSDSPTRTITQSSGDTVLDFATPGHPGLSLDQATGRLYVYATRSDGTGGVVCVDTVAAPTSSNPFCGFTALTGTGEAAESGYSAISAPAAVGSRWFAFNYVRYAGVTGAENTLLCFDLTTHSSCAGQPFALDLGDGTVSTGLPSPGVAAIGNQVIVPITVGQSPELACFDGAHLGACSGDWPVGIGSGYVGSAGPPFPLLTASGGVTGLCLPVSGVPCYSLSGASVGTPAGMANAIAPPTSVWNGPAFVLGPRVYVPNGNRNQVECYDSNASAQCADFPKSFDNLYLLYTVNADPQRPTCIWVNSDSGASQIQNFDAFGGGGCGQGPIRVLASSFVVETDLCTPGSYTSLQVTSPARSTYSSGTVTFADASGNALPGIPQITLDDAGTADLSGLDLSTSSGLPQFLITLNGQQGTPGEVVVKLTWTGTYDPSCLAKPGTSVGNQPPSTTTTTREAAPAPPAEPSDVTVSASAPIVGRVGNTVTFTAVVSNGGAGRATGVLLTASLPAGASLVSASSSQGSCSGTGPVTCPIGTVYPGATVTVTLLLRAVQAQTLSVSFAAVGDYDSTAANNGSSASVAVVPPGAPPPAPPPPSQPGTFNALTTGTVLVNGAPVPADQLFLLKSGDVVDVTNGIITFTTSDGGVGTFSGSELTVRRVSGLAALRRVAASPVPAVFRVDQPASSGSLTTLTLVAGDFSVCTTPRRVQATNKRVVRRLWGKAKGKFRTKARFGAATIRGTIWLTEDRCDGSLVTSVQDVVDVLDESLNKSVALNPGESYLAGPPQSFKPPRVSKKSQTAALVRKNGLRWAGRHFGNRAVFTRWLKSKGGSWQHFHSRHPKLANALAARS